MEINHGLPQEIDSIILIIRNAILKMDREGIHQWDEIYPSRELISSDIAEGCLFAARIEEKIAGIFVLNEHQSPQYQSITWVDNVGKVLVVHRLCVSPAFQGQGIAKEMMRFAEKYAVKNKYSSIRLDALSKNPISNGLYHALGYQRRGNVSFIRGRINYCYEKVL